MCSLLAGLFLGFDLGGTFVDLGGTFVDLGGTFVENLGPWFKRSDNNKNNGDL